MKTTARRRKPAAANQLNLRIDPAFYRAIESIARHERRSVPQAARRLLEDGLQQRVGGPMRDDLPAQDIAHLAAAGGAFDWLADEPELYDDSSGEPL